MKTSSFIQTEETEGKKPDENKMRAHKVQREGERDRERERK